MLVNEGDIRQLQANMLLQLGHVSFEIQTRQGFSLLILGILLGAPGWLFFIHLLKSSSHGANWWRLPQPTATRRTEIKMYTSIDNLILIE